MAYFALPMRDSTIHLLANAAPGLPCSTRIASTSARPHLDAPLTKPLRLHSADHTSDYRRLGATVFAATRLPGSRAVAASVEGNIAVEEPTTAVEEHVPETDAAAAVEIAEKQLAPPRRGAAPRAKPAKVISVQKEQLVPGAVFPGTVRAVQTYGAFVDIGAFTDGLVHISELSATYVRAVQDVIAVGQEVTVRVIEMDEKAGRIALTMRDKEAEETQEAALRGQSEGRGSSGAPQDSQGDGAPSQNRKIAGRGGPSARPKQDDNKKVTKFTKGQELKGSVKNIIRNGAFIELPEGEEGFLRGSEITEGGENVAMESLLTVGQEVNVRVLRIERGRVTLTMKAQVDMKSINKSINKNDDGNASNPFEVFFRNANLTAEEPITAEATAQTETAEEPITAEATAQTETAEEPIASETPVEAAAQ